MRNRRHQREHEIQYIYQAKEALGLADEDFRVFLTTQTGKNHLGRMSLEELEQASSAFYPLIMEHASSASKARLLFHQSFKVQLDFDDAMYESAGLHKPRISLEGTQKQMLIRVYALLGERPVSYAETILKRLYKVTAPERLEWATPKQLYRLTMALAKIVSREREQSNEHY